MTYPINAEEEERSVDAQAEAAQRDYYEGLNIEAIGIARKMLREELGIETAFFDDAVRNAIIFVNVLAKGFAEVDNGSNQGEAAVDARRVLTLIKPTRDRDTV